MRTLLTYILSLFSISTFAQSGVVSSRIAEIQTEEIKLSYNGYVQSAIDGMLEKKSETSTLLNYSKIYLPEIEDSLRARDLPAELKFMVPALSNYDIWKISEDGGSGFWQLRYMVARRYNLKISSYIDERRDLPKATSAALDYLQYLHKSLGDWYGVMAAFVGDETEVRKAIRMAGGDSSYWNYHRFLPLRFQHIVPDFMAHTYVHNYYSELGFQLENIDLTPQVQVPITQWVTIYQLSKALEVDFESLKDANAIYKKSVVPNTDKTYYVKIPTSSEKRFYELGDSIYSYSTTPKVEGQKEPEVKQVDKPKVEEPAEKPVLQSGPRLLYYTVRSGDYLGRIADLYDVGVSEIKRWNNLRSDQININQRLKIYKPASVYNKYKLINSMSAAQKNQLIRKD